MRYLQVTLEANFPIPRIDGSSPGVIAATLHAVNHLRARLAEAHFPSDLPIHIAEAGSFPECAGVPWQDDRRVRGASHARQLHPCSIIAFAMLATNGHQVRG